MPLTTARRVLVTGARGFVGRHVAAELERRGRYRVTGVDAHDRLDALDVFRYGTDRFDLLVHCAAVAPHRAAIDHRTAAVGAGCLELDAAMWRWALRTSPGRVVYLSSSAAYPVGLQTGNPPHRLVEDDIDLAAPQSPDAIYGHVKIMGERLAAAYRAVGRVTVLRTFSGYGEDQPAEWPFGAFAARARTRQDPFVIWGDGRQVRDWVHVEDAAAAIVEAVEQGVDGPINICTGEGTSMADLAGMFCAAAGYTPQFEYRPDRPAGVAHRVGDPARLLEVYTPRITLEEGVKRAVAR